MLDGQSRNGYKQTEYASEGPPVEMINSAQTSIAILIRLVYNLLYILIQASPPNSSIKLQHYCMYQHHSLDDGSVVADR